MMLRPDRRAGLRGAVSAEAVAARFVTARTAMMTTTASSRARLPSLSQSRPWMYHQEHREGGERGEDLPHPPVKRVRERQRDIVLALGCLYEDRTGVSLM